MAKAMNSMKESNPKNQIGAGNSFPGIHGNPKLFSIMYDSYKSSAGDANRKITSLQVEPIFRS
jgi:hypothetical protein